MTSANPIPLRPRIEVESVSPILPHLLLWVDGDPETRWELRQDYINVWDACAAIQQQKADASNTFDAMRRRLWPEVMEPQPVDDRPASEAARGGWG